MSSSVRVCGAFLSIILILNRGVDLAEGQKPFCRYTVIPDANGQFVTVRAEIVPLNRPMYLKDFNQLESIQWFIGDKEIPVKSERKEDTLIFDSLPGEGIVKVVYRLKCVTRPNPEYRKRLMGGVNFLSVREGLFLGVSGYEDRSVEIIWDLPPGWQLGLGEEGVQRFVDTQERLWIAGKMKRVTEHIDGRVFQIALIDGAYRNESEKTINVLRSMFLHSWKNYGLLTAKEYGLVVFPRGVIGGGTRLGWTIAAEEDWITVVHEMLHWWTNPNTPAWFREGIHTYVSAKMLLDAKLINEQQFKEFLDSCLKEHHSVVQREGKTSSLTQSSKDYDSRNGGGDMYGLMPLFAYKLDREIREISSGSDLSNVFAVVCRNRDIKVDVFQLIEKETGYDPFPFFQKYFYAKVENPEELLQ